MLELIQALGLSKASAIAGAVGALIAALRQKGMHWCQRVILFIVGFGIAIFLPKAIITVFKLPEDPSFYAGVGFVFGYFGPALLDVLSEAMESIKKIDWKEIVTGWIRRN